MQKPSQSC